LQTAFVLRLDNTDSLRQLESLSLPWSQALVAPLELNVALRLTRRHPWTSMKVELGSHHWPSRHQQHGLELTGSCRHHIISQGASRFSGLHSYKCMTDLECLTWSRTMAKFYLALADQTQQEQSMLHQQNSTWTSSSSTMPRLMCPCASRWITCHQPQYHYRQQTVSSDQTL